MNAARRSSRRAKAAGASGPVAASACASIILPEAAAKAARGRLSQRGSRASRRSRATPGIGRERPNKARTCRPPSAARMARCNHAASVAIVPSSGTIWQPAPRTASTASWTARTTAGEPGIGPASSHQPTRRSASATGPRDVSSSARSPATSTPTASSPRLRSATRLARNPARVRTTVSRGIVRTAPPPPRTDVRGTIVASPQECAGWRRLPARSLPTASGTTPAATSAASPPLDPPGLRSGSAGWYVRPQTGLSVSWRYIACGTFDLPMMTAPAAARRTTISASAASTSFRRDTRPSVVTRPRTGKHSLTLTGTPARTPLEPALIMAASCSAATRVWINALSPAWRSRCRRTCSAHTSLARADPVATAVAIDSTVSIERPLRVHRSSFRMRTSGNGSDRLVRKIASS